jgi:hypothetical protein
MGQQYALRDATRDGSIAPKAVLTGFTPRKSLPLFIHDLAGDQPKDKP